MFPHWFYSQTHYWKHLEMQKLFETTIPGGTSSHWGSNNRRIWETYVLRFFSVDLESLLRSSLTSRIAFPELQSEPTFWNVQGWFKYLTLRETITASISCVQAPRKRLEKSRWKWASPYKVLIFPFASLCHRKLSFISWVHLRASTT